MMGVLTMEKGNQGSSIYENHGRARSSSSLRNFSPVRSDRSLGPPLAHPMRCAIASYGVPVSPVAASDRTSARMASRITWDLVRPVFLAKRLIRLSVSGSSRTLVGMLRSLSTSPVLRDCTTRVAGTPADSTEPSKRLGGLLVNHQFELPWIAPPRDFPASRLSGCCPRSLRQSKIPVCVQRTGGHNLKSKMAFTGSPHRLESE